MGKLAGLVSGAIVIWLCFLRIEFIALAIIFPIMLLIIWLKGRAEDKAWQDYKDNVIEEKRQEEKTKITNGNK